MGAPRAFIALHIDALALVVDPTEIARPDVVPVREHKPFAGQLVRLALHDPPGCDPADDLALLLFGPGGSGAGDVRHRQPHRPACSDLHKSPPACTPTV
jgi:hypothetical protein